LIKAAIAAKVAIAISIINPKFPRSMKPRLFTQTARLSIIMESPVPNGPVRGDHGANTTSAQGSQSAAEPAPECEDP